MNRFFVPAVFAVGLGVLGWVSLGFVGSSALALAVTLAIVVVYLLGAWELQQFRTATASLQQALRGTTPAPSSLAAWLESVPPSLQQVVRLRVEGERAAMPGPALTPYLVGLLVMLGMLGTFLGMVLTFKGTVFALEGSTDLQAVRLALAAPIKGLGLSFGTSVAGVAASAMLGLMSALCRRERALLARQLDSHIGTVLRPFSRAHQRDESFKAMQLQAQSLPQVAERLHAMVEQMERRDQQLNERLSLKQEQFHAEVRVAYTALAQSVGQSLQSSLHSNAKMASEALEPVVAAAMQHIATESRLQLQRVNDSVQTHMQKLGSDFSATAQAVSQGWQAAQQSHMQGSEQLLRELERSVVALTSNAAQSSDALLTAVHAAATQSQAERAAQDQQRLQDWTQALQSSATTLQEEWQQISSRNLAAQQSLHQIFEQAANGASARSTSMALQAVEAANQLLERSEALVHARTAAEAQWVQEQGARMDQLAGLWRTELQALRTEEAVRGQAAVERLGALQAALAEQLATLGAALEQPIERLMQTASEAPRAAAELMAQLRQEMGRLSERDNLALEERTSLVARISTLLDGADSNMRAQSVAMETLHASTTTLLEQASTQFVRLLDTQSEKTAELSAHISGSAIELASLGESFHTAVQLFTDANAQMISSLQGIEGAVSQSMARSDEQLAYYVGQAREVIDLSLSSQRAVVDDLRRLRSSSVAEAA